MGRCLEWWAFSSREVFGSVLVPWYYSITISHIEFGCAAPLSILPVDFGCAFWLLPLIKFCYLPIKKKKKKPILSAFFIFRSDCLIFLIIIVVIFKYTLYLQHSYLNPPNTYCNAFQIWCPIFCLYISLFLNQVPHTSLQNLCD